MPLRTPAQREALYDWMRTRSRPMRPAYSWDKWCRRMYKALHVAAAATRLGMSHGARRSHNRALQQEAREMAARGEQWCREWLMGHGYTPPPDGGQ